jgi:hypothetical protein
MMLTVLPLIVEPDFTALFVVNTPMNEGTPDDGGGGLVPPVVDQAPPHAAGGVLVGTGAPGANPFIADGAVPSEKVFTFAHELSHHVTVPPPALVSPTTNVPPGGNANTTAVALADEGR